MTFCQYALKPENSLPFIRHNSIIHEKVYNLINLSQTAAISTLSSVQHKSCKSKPTGKNMYACLNR